MLPCSEVHWKILPSVLRVTAEEMEKGGMKKNEIARQLGLTSAAVSQYISGKRGAGKLSAAAKKECAALAIRIAEGKLKKGELDFEISKIVVIAKGSKLGKNDPCIICAGKKVRR
jgi:predicted transcriptional regulator